MELTTLKAYPFFDSERKLTIVEFECPGCGYGHPIHVLPTVGGQHDVWKWNGSLVNPTFEPSVLVHLPEGGVCHSFVREGRIEFLPDSKHALRGTTVNLLEYPESEFDGCPFTVGELVEQWS